MLNQHQTTGRGKKLGLPTVGTFCNTINNMLKVADITLSRANRHSQIDKKKRTPFKVGRGLHQMHTLTGSIRREVEVAVG